ncbi:single-stranded-DNA-specific exonuclease RecJ [Candidatus Falkowbacteria bacterium]|nr:single-stranded-DNA-specific exonuclease RecJ [Candidatus Falkowbacteria bacterium]NCT54724.1 single-stranded-DNA-specific exonuclease RecJ [Candidatus Falkowbacteria bacterium]
MKIWQLETSAPEKLFQDNPNLDPVLLQLLYNRGLTTALEIKEFISGELRDDLKLGLNEGELGDFYNPFLFRDMTAAVDLIISHIKAGNKIVVYGDYDADGVTSSVILLETLKTLKAEVEVYLPDRVSEGYGLNKVALKAIAEQGFKLLITVDNGIRNKLEADYAKELGLDIIITDHHVLPEKEEDYPSCLFIDPADKREKYPFKVLAGVGVAFKLISAILYKSNLEPKQKKLISDRTLDLVAVGTVADMVSLLGENRLLVKKGLEVLNKKKRLGLNKLMEVANINSDKKLEAWNIGWQIGPRLNAASRLAHANSAFALLTTGDEDEAAILAEELNQRNISRQKITEEISSQVEDQIDKNNLPKIIIGIAAEGQIWNEGVIGLVAGRIAEKYYRPTLIITRLVEDFEFDTKLNKVIPKKLNFKGSGRSIEGFNLIEAIEASADYIDKYGGHPMACGLSVKSEEKLLKFKAKLEELASVLSEKDLIPKLKIEAELNFSEINLELLEKIEQLAPFGQHNPQPRFVSYELKINDINLMGFENQHIKLRLISSDNSSLRNHSFWALSFGDAKKYEALKVGDIIDLVYYLDINDFNGRKEPQLKIIDLKLSEINNN